MASADVATTKTKAATAIDLIISFSSSPTKHALSRSRYASLGAQCAADERERWRISVQREA
jgi:hypothetical protein